jgi:hypothetical protein
VGVFAARGNKTALNWLIALANETLERRIDNALGTPKTEDSYEQNTKAFYRELSRVSFMPKYTFWLKMDEDNDNCPPVNYGLAVNQLKRVAHLPLTTVDEYSKEELYKWADVLSVYNAHRINGSYHKGALALVRKQFDVA